MDQDFLNKFIKRANMESDFIKKKNSDPAIIKTLEEHGGKAEDLEEIFGKLMAAGAGEKASSKVISEIVLLQKYLELKENGVSDLEIALILHKQIAGY